MSPSSRDPDEPRIEPELIALTTAAIHGLTSQNHGQDPLLVTGGDTAKAIGEQAANIALVAWHKLLAGTKAK